MDSMQSYCLSPKSEILQTAVRIQEVGLDAKLNPKSCVKNPADMQFYARV